MLATHRTCLETAAEECTAGASDLLLLKSPRRNEGEGPDPGTRGINLQGKSIRPISSESPAKLHCCCELITVLTVAVFVLSVALSVKKTEQISIKNTYAACPSNWIGFGNKCFHFSEYTSNWTSGQSFCMEQGAQLARFDSEEELNFLNRYKGSSGHWIGLHRDSPEHPWRWTDDTEYNNMVSILGSDNYGYIIENVISTGRSYIPRNYVCSMSISNTLQCEKTP